MTLVFAVISIAIFQLAGLGLIVWFLTKSLEAQTKTVQMLAMFKKATNPGELSSMIDLTEEIGKVEKVEIREEQTFYPHEMNEEQLSLVRNQM